jgi:tetratricopeptide (TPR) repeat protein
MKKWALIALLVNAAYLAAFASPTVFYMANAGLHLMLGLLALALFWRKPWFWVAAAFGIFLALKGNLTEYRWVLLAHVAAGVVAVTLWNRKLAVYGVAMAALMLLPEAQRRIVNPKLPPASMEEEGGGPQSPFFPSSAKTNVGGIIPANFFMDSEACGECHKEIYEQWKSSVHHFASFNNQFYRKSIEYMQDVVGTQPSKWCAGCHDHAVFFNGRFDKPIKEQIDTPEAHAGLACTSCHSIVHVDSSMGNGGFTIEYPPLHDLASSKNRYIRALDYFLTYLDPEPHRKTFMKPFMRLDASEYCSTCHKVHLDVPVNDYRWFRGFNDYDNWQASGVSGQGARSFYYPEKSSNCVDCHMPLVDSREPGHHDGKIHSHRFPAANMAVPFVNGDKKQMEITEAFLKSGFVTVDIFAVSPVEEQAAAPMLRRTGDAPRLMTGFAVGEEAEQQGAVTIREVGKLAAPVGRAAARVEPGSTARVDVVVRTRRIGHFFPGGTVDGFDVWLELQARDADGRVVYWSGRVEDEGKGPVEKGAHFYRSFLLDAEGNHINKRNAWQARSLLYARLIPPGAADVAHFRIQIPKDAKGPLTLEAKLNYRKFAHWYTQFAYENVPNVSGKIKDRVPNLPIVTLAQNRAKLEVGAPEWNPAVDKRDRERWNDWGIGLLLQGDLKGAEYAFKKVTEAEPEYADGWLNVARALIQEGETEAAKPYIRKALDLNPALGRIYYFKGLVEKADGDYDAALGSLRRAEALYPRDRVVLNQIARILFLQRKYAEALMVLERVARIDPEDLQMHYTAMLSHRGLGDETKAAHSETLFRRFKAEESSQEITAKIRQLSPEDNNERQIIHEHESANLEPQMDADRRR